MPEAFCIDVVSEATNARLNNVDPKAWLADVFRRIAEIPQSTCTNCSRGSGKKMSQPCSGRLNRRYYHNPATIPTARPRWARPDPADPEVTTVDSDVRCNPVDSIGSSTESRVSHSEPPPSARFPRDKDGSARRNIEPVQ